MKKEIKTLLEKTQEKIQELKKTERRCLDKKLSLGELAHQLKIKVKKSGEIWLDFCSKNFDEDSNRVNESISLYKLHQQYSGNDWNSVSMTVQVILGQALATNKESKKELVEKIIENQEVLLDEKTISLSEMTVRDLRKFLSALEPAIEKDDIEEDEQESISNNDDEDNTRNSDEENDSSDDENAADEIDDTNDFPKKVSQNTKNKEEKPFDEKLKSHQKSVKNIHGFFDSNRTDKKKLKNNIEDLVEFKKSMESLLSLINQLLKTCKK